MNMKDWVGQQLEKRRIKAVLPHIRGRLLDVGCGSNRLVRRYGDGIGVDVHQWGDVDVMIDNAARLPFADASFQTVTVLAALNHIPNRQEALREMHRVLIPEGQLLMTMIPPGISRVWHTFRRPWDADQAERGMKKGEVYGLTGAETQWLLESAGFSVEHEERFMLGLNLLTVART